MEYVVKEGKRLNQYRGSGIYFFFVLTNVCNNEDTGSIPVHWILELFYRYYRALVVLAPRYFHITYTWTSCPWHKRRSPAPDINDRSTPLQVHNREGNCWGSVDQLTAPQCYVIFLLKKGNLYVSTELVA